MIAGVDPGPDGQNSTVTTLSNGKYWLSATFGGDSSSTKYVFLFRKLKNLIAWKPFCHLEGKEGGADVQFDVTDECQDGKVLMAAFRIIDGRWQQMNKNSVNDQGTHFDRDRDTAVGRIH